MVIRMSGKLKNHNVFRSFANLHANRLYFSLLRLCFDRFSNVLGATWLCTSSAALIIAFLSCRQLFSFQVSSEITDFAPCAHAQSNILHVKYAEKTDY